MAYYSADFGASLDAALESIDLPASPSHDQQEAASCAHRRILATSRPAASRPPKPVVT